MSSIAADAALTPRRHRRTPTVWILEVGLRGGVKRQECWFDQQDVVSPQFHKDKKGNILTSISSYWRAGTPTVLFQRQVTT